MEKQDDPILLFLQDQNILEKCIVPNVTQIFADGKITLSDVPVFLRMISSIFQTVDAYLLAHKTVKLTTNNVIDVVGLLVRVIVIVSMIKFGQLGEIPVAMTLIDVALQMIKTKITNRSCSIKLCCC